MTSFKNVASKEDVVSNFSSNLALKARFKQSLPDASSTIKRSLQDILFQQLVYH